MGWSALDGLVQPEDLSAALLGFRLELPVVPVGSGRAVNHRDHAVNGGPESFKRQLVVRAEQVLLDRAASPEIAGRFNHMVTSFKDYFHKHHEPSAEYLMASLRMERLSKLT